jgi:molybdopterin adenylyltransferase
MRMKAKVIAVCVSERKGTVKQPVEKIQLKTEWGVEGDAHAGSPIRQVSLLSQERIDAFNQEQGMQVGWGAFGENIVLQGVDPSTLPLGTIIAYRSVVMMVSQIGKECHSGCAIQKRTGTCIMPMYGTFARVLHDGTLKAGDVLSVYPQIRVAVVCLSDRCSRGEAEDKSSPVIVRMVEEAGCAVVSQTLLPDGIHPLSDVLRDICDGCQADVVLTTGGTGLSPRDLTPEATLSVAERQVPGIAEAMRAASLAKTPHGMLSRAVAVIRNKTLVVNLPGSPKAVEENLSVVLPVLEHAVQTMKGVVGDCNPMTRSQT